jgi:hypothetical protein
MAGRNEVARQKTAPAPHFVHQATARAHVFE